jgi:anti-sigma factor RsiW
MNCVEVAECVSALFDGEPISREAAAHLSDCEECRVRLNDHAEMSAELRRVASGVAPQAIPEGRWMLAEPAAAANWLKKWRGTMRIPRFAFALMLLAIFAPSYDDELRDVFHWSGTGWTRIKRASSSSP